jgi:N,N'-diacetyllegionaminate synthase
LNSAKMTYVIAEAGVNHNGSLDTARRLVVAAKACGADAVKFQTFRAENLVTRTAAMAAYQEAAVPCRGSQYDMLKRLELKEDDFRDLLHYCRENEIAFMSSPFDEESADMLDALGVLVFKIPSGEITNTEYLKHVARKNKPLILSTGMCTLGEVESAVSLVRDRSNAALTLLHCVTEYPAPYQEINLQAMVTLREAFKLPVGYSDHTPGLEVPMAAVALGATIIEKHFTLDTRMEGPDHQASLDPQHFKRLVQGIRHVEQALGDGVKRPAACELKNIAVVRKSIVAAKTIEAGETIERSTLTVKRPGHGIPPGDMPKLIGMKATHRIDKDEVLTWKHLS